MSKKAQFPDEQGEDGAFERQKDAFDNWIEDKPDAQFPAVSGRYHLYVSLACPWAHRTIIMRERQGLAPHIGMTVVDPIRDDKGWRFVEDVPGCEADPVNGFQFLSEAYHATDPDYKGRITVPVLWDKETKRIVSNNDDAIMRMFNNSFSSLTGQRHEHCPEVLLPEIDRLNELIYETVNNGVYKAGFASSQKAYENAVYPLFDTLDMLESRLSRSPFLIGDSITETDWRLWVTLIRFDAVYHGHFKCNIRRLVDYPNLINYTQRLYNEPGIAETVDFSHIKRHYYLTHDELNPSGILPAGPRSIWT
ncbi:glutathione S-transferase family protein [Pelagicoccus sp. SDUM812002]|uniref:glutathione S-transferase family protein n=1 Tax=Pelagicoccus sp. SDUM812002 TaxID=3041266 RepID=UPI00280C9DD7|nr:glutathione S-transferase family protein [Pelagicoccus sp. SDUM812002]MDQ8186786.1 glutathione S-transferase family protein [Pelagicoccus sp. SDUM812002]